MRLNGCVVPVWLLRVKKNFDSMVRRTSHCSLISSDLVITICFELYVFSCVCICILFAVLVGVDVWVVL